MIDLIFFLFSSLLFYISYYLVGLFIFEKFYSKVKIINYHETTLIGLFFISFISLIINFFIPLSPKINLIFLIATLSLFFFIKKQNFIKILKLSCIFIISLIIFTLFARNPEDASLYHLSYISLLNSEQISFGLTNFHSRFGHTSIIQYLSAISYIPALSKYTIITQNNFIYCLIITILISKLKLNLKNKESYNVYFNFLCLIFICLKLAKFSDWGNDLAPAILTFYITSFLIDYLTRDQINKNFGYIYFFLLLIITFIVFSKISYIILYFVLLILFFKEKNIIKYFDLRIVLSISFILSILFIKNIIISSCIIYPIPSLCFETAWSSGEFNNVNNLYLEAKSWSMGISDLKSKSINQELFVKDFNWLGVWLNNHFIKVNEKIFSFVFFSLIILSFYKFKFRASNQPAEIPKFHKYIFILFSIFTSFWFISAPLFRYGIGFIIIFIILIIIPILLKYLNFTNYDHKTFSKFTIIILILTILTKNIVRVSNNSENNIIPKTFDETYLNFLEINGNNVFYKNGSECFYPKNSPCLKYKPKGIKTISNLGKYKIYIHF